VNVAPVLLVVAVLAVATGLGLWWRARNGRYTAVSPTVLASAQADTAVGPDEDLLSAAELGAPHGTRATFVQLSSAVCAPCRRMHAVLADLAGSEPGVVHVDLDVEQHLDLVRRFQVLRTPTTLVLDARGVVVGRLSGAADRRQVHAALDAASCPDGAAATR
jgi:thiol-disulfide isomerase/thioredoxin